MLTSSRSYAIGSAHFQLAGGWRSMAWLCGGYVGAVAVVYMIWKYESLATPAPLSSVAVSLIIIAQSLALLLFGSMRIAKTVKTDVDSRMLESYRLMPIASSRAVLGYMFGSNAHTIAFAGVNLLLAYVFAGLTGSSASQVTLAMSVLAIFALFIWSAAAMGSFHGKAMASLISLATVGTTMGGFFLYQFVPAIALLLTPLAGETIFHVSSGPARIHAAYGVSLLAQGAFIAIFYRVACRAYRGTFPTTFSLAQAAALLLTWCASSIAGILLWEDIHLASWRMNSGVENRTAVQVVASVIVAMLLVAAPLRTLIVCSWQWPRGRRIVATVATLALATLAITSMGLSATGIEPALPVRVAITAAIVTMHVTGFFCLLWVMRRAKPGPTIVSLLIAALLLWGVPLVVELFQYLSARDAYGNYLPTSGFAASFSPLGLLAQTWQEGPHPSPAPSLIVQFLLIAAFAAVALKPRTAKAAASPGAPPTPLPSLTPSAPVTDAASPEV